MSVQTLTNDVLVLILCLSYFITTVHRDFGKLWADLRKTCGYAPVLNNVTVNNWYYQMYPFPQRQ